MKLGETVLKSQPSDALGHVGKRPYQAHSSLTVALVAICRCLHG